LGLPVSVPVIRVPRCCQPRWQHTFVVVVTVEGVGDIEGIIMGMGQCYKTSKINLFRKQNTKKKGGKKFTYGSKDIDIS